MLQYDIKVSCPIDLTKRAFISITINGTRYKEYSGNRINIDLKPNKAQSTKERNVLLKQLEYEFRKKLEDGTYQQLINQSDGVGNRVEDLVKKALKQKAHSNLSVKYVNSMKQTGESFLEFLSDGERKGDIHLLKKGRVQDYLDQFRNTPNYYMSKRRELGSLFGCLKKMYDLKCDPMKGTGKIKTQAKLHKIYSQKQLKDVLSYLKTHHENLYLCCLISYGCFLRPHKEVKNLKGSHFKMECSEIHLSGTENKSGRIRVVYIPDYVKAAIHERVSMLSIEGNLFSLCAATFNEYYFNTAWSRHFKEMLKLGIVEQNQTIYSFRHTAAVNIYKKTKDLHLLQQLLGHSNMIVTLKYLRGLGVHSNDELKNIYAEL